jgi:phosphate starvation-inducible protein PhoH
MILQQYTGDHCMPKNLALVDEQYLDKYLERRTRKQRKRNKNTGLKLEEIEPLTKTQGDVFDSWDDGYNMVLHGCAGTGKTFLSLYLALDEVMNKKSDKRKVSIVRSVVPTRDMGFLPGNMTEKSKAYESPYMKMCSDIFNRGDAYGQLKAHNTLEFLTTSFIRGETWDDTIIIVDEFQNMSFQELHSVMTRIGENSKIVFCGDIKQDDLTSERYNTQSGIDRFMKILFKMDSFDCIDFKPEDIVRSGIVREYIEKCYELNVG